VSGSPAWGHDSLTNVNRKRICYRSLNNIPSTSYIQYPTLHTQDPTKPAKSGHYMRYPCPGRVWSSRGRQRLWTFCGCEGPIWSMLRRSSLVIRSFTVIKTRCILRLMRQIYYSMSFHCCEAMGRWIYSSDMCVIRGDADDMAGNNQTSVGANRPHSSFSFFGLVRLKRGCCFAYLNGALLGGFWSPKVSFIPLN
jgi:hypothetical protein